MVVPRLPLAHGGVVLHALTEREVPTTSAILFVFYQLPNSFSHTFMKKDDNSTFLKLTLHYFILNGNTSAFKTSIIEALGSERWSTENTIFDLLLGCFWIIRGIINIIHYRLEWIYNDFSHAPALPVGEQSRRRANHSIV